MALRSTMALPALGRRLFSTTRPVANFADLARITSTSTPTPAPSAFSAALPSPRAEGRGYAPGAMPLKVDPTLELFTNMLMSDGKKGEAQRHAANVLRLIQEATNSPPLPQLHRAIELASPSVQLLSMRKSAKTVMTPRALTERQRVHTGIKWLLKTAERGRKGGVKRDDRIAREVLAVLDGSSEVFRRVEEVHKIAMLQRYVPQVEGVGEGRGMWKSRGWGGGEGDRGRMEGRELGWEVESALAASCACQRQLIPSEEGRAKHDALSSAPLSFPRPAVRIPSPLTSSLPPRPGCLRSILSFPSLSPSQWTVEDLADPSSNINAR